MGFLWPMICDIQNNYIESFHFPTLYRYYFRFVYFFMCLNPFIYALLFSFLLWKLVNCQSVPNWKPSFILCICDRFIELKYIWILSLYILNESVRYTNHAPRITKKNLGYKRYQHYPTESISVINLCNLSLISIKTCQMCWIFHVL